MSKTRNSYLIACLYILLFYNRTEIFGDQVGAVFFYFIIAVFWLKDGINRAVMNSMKLLFVPILYSLLLGIFHYGMYDVFKDTFYFLSPIFSMYFGCVLAQRYDAKTLLKATCLAGLISSVQFLVRVYSTAGLAALYNPRAARTENELLANSLITLSILILFYRTLYQKKRGVLLLFLLNFIAIYVTGSRTYWVTTIVGMLIIALPSIRRHYIKWSLAGLLGVFILGTVIMNNTDNTTIQTLLRSKNEITLGDYRTDEDINNNYRGFEAYRAMITFRGFSPMHTMFGGGFGTKVDVLNSDLVGSRYIPILHNGYPYILIKSGLVGLLCYLLWGILLLRKLYRSRRNVDNDMSLILLLSTSSIAIVFITNLVITGLFNTIANSALFFVAAYIYYQQKLSCKKTLRYR